MPTKHIQKAIFLRPLVRFEHIFAQPPKKAPKNRSATDSTDTRDLKRTKTSKATQKHGQSPTDSTDTRDLKRTKTSKATQKHGQSPTDSTDTRDHKRTKTLNNRSCDPGILCDELVSQIKELLETHKNDERPRRCVSNLEQINGLNKLTEKQLDELTDGSMDDVIAFCKKEYNIDL